MSKEASQKVMLYFLEVLLNSKRTFTISQLVGHLGNPTFTPEMRTAAGVNQKGLQEFFAKYPFLFTMQGDNVFLTRTEITDQEQEPSQQKIKSDRNAVEYLSRCIAKHKQLWVPIRCLTGHFSQMTEEMRRTIGPQKQLKMFLVSHPLVFEVSDEFVRLRLEATPLPFSKINKSKKLHEPHLPAPELISTPSKMIEVSGTSGSNSLNPHFINKISQQKSMGVLKPLGNTRGNTDLSNSRDTLMKMTINEYAAIILLKNHIEKSGATDILHLMQFSHLSISENVRSILGSTRAEFENFLRKHAQIFRITSDDRVDLVKNAKLCVVITGSKSSDAENCIMAKELKPLSEFNCNSTTIIM